MAIPMKGNINFSTFKIAAGNGNESPGKPTEMPLNQHIAGFIK